MSVNIVDTDEYEECTCGIVTVRKMTWVFAGEEIHRQMAFCHSCEEDLKSSIERNERRKGEE